MTHPAIKAFVEQPLSAISVSTLGGVVEALHDGAVVAALTSPAQRTAVCSEVLKRLVAVANDSAKGTAVRLMGLESLYWISQVPDDAFRQTQLFTTVEQLNQSFDDLLESDAEAMASQREMITVLLLRCTGYTRLSAGDLLAQLCGGDQTQLVTLLLKLATNRQYEWAILQAAVRALYQLTIPTSYYQASATVDSGSTQSVTAFQGKVTSLLLQCTRQQVLSTILAELTARWASSVAAGDDAGLGYLGSITGQDSVQALTTAQTRALVQWAAVLRHVSLFVQNLADFADLSSEVRVMQQGLLATGGEGGGFWTTVLVPFAAATTRAWQVSKAAGATAGSSGQLSSSSLGEAAQSVQESDPLLAAAIGALRLLRMALYKPASSSLVTSATTVHALACLTQQVTQMEPLLRSTLAGLMILLLVTECLVNVNAAGISSPVDLAAYYTALLTVIAADHTLARPGSLYTFSQCFLLCWGKEESSYCETANASAQLLRTKFSTQERQLRDDAEAAEALLFFTEQLELLQSMIAQITLDQLLIDLLETGERWRTPADHRAMEAVITGKPSPSSSSTATKAGAAQKPKKAKKKAPPQYCCQLTGKLMREPVTLKNGHHFELDALQGVIDQVGHVDPISGETIDEPIEVDAALQNEIAQFRVTRAAASSEQ